MSCSILHTITWGQLFKTFNLDQNYPDLEIPFFAIQDQVIRLTFMMVFQSNIGLDQFLAYVYFIYFITVTVKHAKCKI